MICKKCVLPESKPDIWLDDNGICNICDLHEKSKNTNLNSAKPLEIDFVRLINKYRGKHKYDCLVMLSGGKDSTASLYYSKIKYKLNPLAFTFDHGFETEEAMENIKNAVEILGVDFLYFKTDFIKDMFKKIIESKSKAVICHPCSIWYMQLTFEIAERYDIPIIIAGWTKGQSNAEVMTKCACNIDAPEFASMSMATRLFLYTLKSDPKYKNFPSSMEVLLKEANKSHKTLVLSPHWFLDTHPDEYTEILKKELNWKFPLLSYPAKSTNCYMNFVSVYYSMKHYGYTHYHVEMSKMIRANLLTREEALKNLEINFDNELLDKIVAKLGIKIE